MAYKHSLLCAIGTLHILFSIGRQWFNTNAHPIFMQQRLPTRHAFGLVFLSLGVLWLTACASKPVTENVPPPRIDQLMQQPVGDAPQNMLDWSGTYQAVLPCNACPGIAMSVQLREDHTAVVRERKLGSDIEKAPAQTYNGAFYFDSPHGSLISLSTSAQEAPAYKFWVSEGWIELRERSTGNALPQSSMYRLRKTSQPSN